MTQEIINDNEKVVEKSQHESTVIEQTITDSVVANILHYTGGQENLLAISEEYDHL